MWTKILSKYGIKMPFKKFVLYGGVIALPTIAVSTLSLLLVL
jgi:Na+/H+ antiporter NhaD/arsenite permease-like protein